MTELTLQLRESAFAALRKDPGEFGEFAVEWGLGGMGVGPS